MKFEVGNKIYCSYHKAAGTITDIEDPKTVMYPILVTFEDRTTDTYTIQGRRLTSGDICLKLVEKEPDSLTLEYVEGLGKIFTLSCGTRILKTLENTHIILPQTSNL